MSTIAETFDDHWLAVPGPLDTPCHIWQRGLHRNGYGQIAIAGRKTTAHRWSWVRSNGPVPYGLCVLHRCDMRACVNRTHLFLGTKKDNTQDMLAKGRLVIGARPRGEANHKAKLTEALVRQMRSDFAASVSIRALARQSGLSRPAVRAVCTRQNWKHVA